MIQGLGKSMSHVRFLEWHNGDPIQVDVIEHMQTLTMRPTMIGQIANSSTKSPMIVNDEEENMSVPMLVPQVHTEQTIPITDHTNKIQLLLIAE